MSKIEVQYQNARVLAQHRVEAGHLKWQCPYKVPGFNSTTSVGHWLIVGEKKGIAGWGINKGQRKRGNFLIAMISKRGRDFVGPKRKHCGPEFIYTVKGPQEMNLRTSYGI